MTIRHCRTIVRLDHPGQAAALEADPDAALRGLDEPVLLDGWQDVPQVLDVVRLEWQALPSASLLITI